MTRMSCTHDTVDPVPSECGVVVTVSLRKRKRISNVWSSCEIRIAATIEKFSGAVSRVSTATTLRH